jgi:hypothetical protein
MPTTSFRRDLIFFLLLVTCTGCLHRSTSAPAPDSSARLEERKQRSVTDDPAFNGDTPDGWLVANDVKVPAQQALIKGGARDQEQLQEPKDSEIAEFAEQFKNMKPPQIFQGELPPHRTRIADLQLTGPAGLTGSVQWIGTAAAMQVTMVVNASPLASGKTYRLGTQAGGSYVTAQTPVGGHATLMVTNPSNTSVKVRILLTATSR